jgi:hypothetical protein
MCHVMPLLLGKIIHAKLAVFVTALASNFINQVSIAHCGGSTRIVRKRPFFANITPELPGRLKSEK